MINICQKISASEFFQRFIFFLIVLTAVSMGFEAVPEFSQRYDALLYYVSIATQAIFVFEISVRLLAHGLHPQDFFRDRWNSFDFVMGRPLKRNYNG